VKEKPPRTMTPSEMRQEADRLDTEIERLRARASQLRQVADQVERLSKMESLTPEGQYATFATMATANVATTTPLHRGAPLESDGPIATAARKLGIHSADVARLLGVNPGTARNWDKRGRVPNDTLRQKLAELVAAKGQKPAKPGRS